MRRPLQSLRAGRPPGLLLPLTLLLLVASAGVASAAPPAAQIGFAAGPTSPVTVGTRPVALAVGDLNGDDNLDFVTANFGSDTYTPVYGNGAGGFTAGTPEDTGDGPQSIVLADFNADTRLDIAVANRNVDTVWVLLQQADGSFDQQEPIPSGGDEPVAMAAGRVDANDSVDLVVANGAVSATGRRYSVLLNQGTGFTPANGSPILASSAAALVPGDFDEDGALDFLSNDGFLRLGNGDGTFGPATRSVFPGSRTRLATGDIDGDGHLDLVAAGSNGVSTLVLLGTGAGGFYVQEEFPPNLGIDFVPNTIAIGRFNADPYGDVVGTFPVVTGGAETHGEARVVLGDDDGGLSATIPNGPWPTGLGPNAVAVGDFNNDGRPDFLAANSGLQSVSANSVSVLLNTTPWPLAQFSGDRHDFGQHEIGSISLVATLSVANAGQEVLQVRGADLGGANPDDFLKTSDTCTGASVPPGGGCSIKIRFAPTAEGDREATLRMLDNTVAGSHTARFAGVGAAPSNGGGSTGPQGPPGSTGPAGPQGTQGPAGTDGTDGAPGQKGSNGGPGVDGATGATGPQGPTGRQGRPGRDATITCKPKRSRSGKVRVTCTVRFVSARRASVRVRLVRGRVVYASARRAVGRGRVSLRVRPTSRLRHARYRLLLTFIDREGRATTLEQRVRLRRGEL
jgi:FG-GAP repeat